MLGSCLFSSQFQQSVTITHRKRKFKWSSKGNSSKNPSQLERKPLMPSFRSPLPTLSCFFLLSGVEVTLHPPVSDSLFLSHFLNTVRKMALHLPAKLPKPGLLGSPRARTRTHAHRGNSGTERPGIQSLDPESPHHRPSGFSQSGAVREYYANNPFVP